MMKDICKTVAIVSLFACGGGNSSTSPTTAPSGNTAPPTGGISVINNAYSPATKAVPVGTTVQWAWNTCDNTYGGGMTCGSHSVTFDDGTGQPAQDQGTFTKMFNVAGTFNYHCTVHPEMTGTITVQ